MAEPGTAPDPLRDRIIDAALALAEEDAGGGWYDLPLHLVARRLGVPLGVVLERFRDADAIADAWFARALIAVEGEEVTIKAGFLAAKLGLSVDRLRAEMRRGIVYGVSERGVGEDAGRLRLTFRYRARSWTVVVEADGTLDEAPAQAPAR